VIYRDANTATATVGSHSNTGTHTYGTAKNLTDAIRTGYRFDGWYTDQEATANRVTVIGATAYIAGPSTCMPGGHRSSQ
jgi:uncharacterized repeat protein (TIGR02543 family)